MRIAIPLANGKLAMHFGHCESFALIDVDDQKKEITGKSEATPPAHEPGVLPEWLVGQRVSLVITGGMGQRAQALLAQYGIETIVGAGPDAPERIVAAYLDGGLALSDNVCDH